LHRDELAGDRIVHSRNGWELLQQHRPDEALNAFAVEAQAHPRQGMPKVGYALATAENGKLDRGVWAMRRTLRFETEALRYMEVKPALRESIRKLIRRYEYESGHVKAVDTTFMHASLHYLLHENLRLGRR